MSHTFIVIIITVIISLLAWQNDKLFDSLIFNPQKIKQGEVYRMLTHGFIHADGMHLLFNMITLYFFGRATERFFNHYVNGFGLIVFYLFAIVASIIPMPAIVFAIGYIAYSVYAGKKGGSNINHSAHLWGAGFGVVASIAIEPALLLHFLNALTHPSF